MGFIEELKWRNMLQDMSEGVEAHLDGGMRTGYIGFDPTAPSMTIGNFVQIMILKLFQNAGHKPIVLMGGATGRIGDPSGKDKERELQSYEVLDHNLRFQQKQAEKFLNFHDGPNAAIVYNNLQFYEDLEVIDFLRDVGKHMTVNYMLSKEAVKNRFESGISYTEFSYQLLQAHDFKCLYAQFGCTLQMGGSDQWGNITSGTEYIRKTLAKKAYGVTTPLLTKSDGKKFGKSEEGNIWLDPGLTSPYQFYQFWINADDQDVPKFLRYFSLKSKEEVEALEAQYQDNPRQLKEKLAEELTIRVHSEEDFQNVQNVSQIIFNPRADHALLHALSLKELHMISREIPSFEVPREYFQQHINLIDLMAEHTGIVRSKSEARRAIQSNAVSVNKQKETSIEATLRAEHLLHGEYVMIENGKKNKFLVKVTS